MKIQILAEDIKDSNYTSGTNCAVARAVKRLFPEECVNVSPQSIIVGTDFKKYTYSKEDETKLCKMYLGSGYGITRNIGGHFDDEIMIDPLEPQDFEIELIEL